METLPDVDWADSPPEEAVQEFLIVLDQHRIACEESGRYEEAELARDRLAELRTQEEQRRRAELRSEQLGERLDVEEAHMKELQEFNAAWDAKFAEFEDHAQKLQEMLAERHAQDHAMVVEKLREETLPRAPHWSRALLEKRKVQQLLAKQKRYAEARSVSNDVERLEVREYEAWFQRRELKITAGEEKFIAKQKLEMEGLRKRIQSGREEQRQSRKDELMKTLRRYQNAKQAIETQQSLIRIKVEKGYAFAAPQRSTMSRAGSSTPLRGSRGSAARATRQNV